MWMYPVNSSGVTVTKTLKLHLQAGSRAPDRAASLAGNAGIPRRRHEEKTQHGDS